MDPEDKKLIALTLFNLESEIIDARTVARKHGASKVLSELADAFAHVHNALEELSR